MSNATVEPIKLKNAGDKHTMDVQFCRKLPFGDFPEFEFQGRDGSVVRVPESSTLRQFERLAVNEESIVGRRVTIKRDKNAKQPSKPYWGIYLEDGAESSGGTGGAASAAKPGTGTLPTHTTTGTTQPRPATQKDVERIFDAEPVGEAKKPTGYALYRQITEKVLADIIPIYEKNGIQFDGADVAAICATLFIQASRNGH